MFVYVLPAAHGITSTCLLFIYQKKTKAAAQKKGFHSFVSAPVFQGYSLSLFLTTYVYVFAFAPVLNVFSAACGNNQITYSSFKKKGVGATVF